MTKRSLWEEMRSPVAEMTIRARFVWCLAFAPVGAAVLAALDPVPFSDAFPLRLLMMVLLVVFVALATVMMAFFNRGQGLLGLATLAGLLGGLWMLWVFI